MKPKSESTRQASHLDNDGSRRILPARPLINYSYQALPGALPATRARNHHGAKRSVLAARFRQISRDFLGAESTRDFVAELLFFVVITGVSAWPIVSMFQALEHWMK